MDAIVGERLLPSGDMHYKVRWKGYMYGHDELSWVLLSDLKCDKLLNRWNKQRLARVRGDKTNRTAAARLRQELGLSGGDAPDPTTQM